MNKCIASYSLKNRLDVWDDTIAHQFKKQMSKYGVISFESGSDLEAEFQKVCTERSIEILRKTIQKCTGKDLYRHPYHFLTVKPDKSVYDEKLFMDTSRVCAGGGQVLCKIGAEQTQKIWIDLKKSKKLDIMTVPNIHTPKIHIISRKLKQIMEPLALSGYRVVPCLEKGKRYSEYDMRLDTASAQLEEEANYFQLVIEQRVLNPPCAGNLIRVFSQCAACKTVYGFNSDTTPYFSVDDLENTDFQLFNEYITSDGSRFTIAGEIAIISSTVLQVLIDQKITGLASYLTDPPIKHGVVELG